MDTNIKSNSHKAREREGRESTNVPEKKVEKVISGTAKVKKKSGMHKFTDIFVSEDVSNVKQYILLDVLLPAVKKAISDVVTNGIEMLLYGETNRKRNGNASKVTYRSYDRVYDRRDAAPTRSRMDSYSYDDIVLDSRGEAEEVLERMDELIDRYKAVSVADLYEMVGIRGNYTDFKYGWTDLRTATVQRVRDGYLLKLPRAYPV